MYTKLRNLCFVCTLALIGADRIDFFFGHGPFILTPFLVFASGVALFTLLGSGIALRTNESLKRQTPFLVGVKLLMVLGAASVPFALEPQRGLVVFVNLLLMVSLGYFMSVQILTEFRAEQWILKSVTFGVVIYALFCVIEFIVWTRGVVLDPYRINDYSESVFASLTLGNLAPRLSGTTFDPNRSGFVMLMYLFLLDRFVRKSFSVKLLCYAIVFFLFLTVSRSAILAWVIYQICSSGFWSRATLKRALLIACIIVLVCGVGMAMYGPQIDEFLNDGEFAIAMSGRISMNPNTSGGDHIAVIQRGIEVWKTSPKTMLLGIGLGSGSEVLHDLLGEDKHINFHCIYVTILAELGFPAFLTLMFLFLAALATKKGAAPIVLAIMAFNLSYQAHLEPIFWMTLALCWASEGNLPKLFRQPEYVLS